MKLVLAVVCLFGATPTTPVAVATATPAKPAAVATAPPAPAETPVAAPTPLALNTPPPLASETPRAVLDFGDVMPPCVAVLEFMGTSAESGKVVSDMAARRMRARNLSVLERKDVMAFLQSRQLAIPNLRDAVSVSAIGTSLQSDTVLDGIVVEYSDGSSASDQPGRVAVEVLLRLVDSRTKKIVWEGTGRATGGSIFRFQRTPLADVAEKAVKKALASFPVATKGTAATCPTLGSTELVTTAAEQSIVAQSELGGAPPLRIVRSYSAPSGEKRTIDISEVRVLHFNSEEAAIKSGMELLITEIASVLRDNADLRLVIEGHSDADPKKTAEVSFKLSLDRALAVFHALRKDVDARRMFVQAAGTRSPVAPNDTKFNQTLNRRVEFKFLAGAQ